MATFPFGLDRERLVEQVSAISEGLKSGDVIPQAVTYGEEQSTEDFTIRTISLTFAMRKDDNASG